MEPRPSASPTSRRSMEKESRGSYEGRGRRPAVSPLHVPGGLETPIKTPSNPAEVFDLLERENESIVNKLQREISQLRNDRSRSRSQSTSSSSSVSRNQSMKSVYVSSDGGEDLAHGVQRPSRGSFSHSEDSNLVQSLRKENELLKKKLADLSIKLTEKESELEAAHKQVKDMKISTTDNAGTLN